MGCPSMGCLVNDEKYLIMAELETEVKLLKKELQDQAKIHDRLDIAIEKLTDVSNSIHRMLAVHEEKITSQESKNILNRINFSKNLTYNFNFNGIL